MLPREISMRPVSFSDGVGGWVQQETRNDEFGVTCVSERESREKPFIRTWSIDTMPDKTFANYRELFYAVKTGGKVCDHVDTPTEQGYRNRHRLNADMNGYAFEYKHCSICGHNEFISGRRTAFDAAQADDMLN